MFKSEELENSFLPVGHFPLYRNAPGFGSTIPSHGQERGQGIEPPIMCVSHKMLQDLFGPIASIV